VESGSTVAVLFAFSYNHLLLRRNSRFSAIHLFSVLIMRLFIKRTLLFFLAVILLITVLQAIISIRISGKTVTGHDNLELTSNVNADLIFLGSSRCWTQFDPKFFDTIYHLKSVNIGVDGHSEIDMAMVRLKTYLLTNKPPQKAIFSFDPFMSGGPNLVHNPVHKDNFARYAFLPSKKDCLIVDYFQFDFYEKYIPLYAMLKYKHTGDAILMNNIDNWVIYGYEKHDEKWDTQSNPVSDIGKQFYFKMSQSNEVSQALDSLKQICELNKIKLICIQTPVYKVLYDEQLFSETGKICSRLKIPFIDADKEYFRNDMDLFFNVNHLNKAGVDKFNEFLKNDSQFNAYMKLSDNLSKKESS